MIEDILTLPEIATIGGKEYKIQFTCKSYGILESMTKKSTFEIRDLMLDGRLGIIDSIEVICAGLVDNQTEAEIQAVRKFIQENLHIISDVNMAVVQAFIKPLMPPEIYKKLVEAKQEIKNIVEEKGIKKKRKKAS